MKAKRAKKGQGEGRPPESAGSSEEEAGSEEEPQSHAHGSRRYQTEASKAKNREAQQRFRDRWVPLLLGMW